MVLEIVEHEQQTLIGRQVVYQQFQTAYAFFLTSGEFRFQLLVADVCLPYLTALYRDHQRTAALQEVECQVVGNATELGAKGCLLRIIPPDVAESPEEGVLRQFLGIHHIWNKPRNHSKDFLPIATDHLVLSLALAVSYGFNNLFVCLHFLQVPFLFLLIIRLKQKNIPPFNIKIPRQNLKSLSVYYFYWLFRRSSESCRSIFYIIRGAKIVQIE